MLYFNEKIPCKILQSHPVVPFAEINCIKFHQLKRNWLHLGFYKSPIQTNLRFIEFITKILDF